MSDTENTISEQPMAEEAKGPALRQIIIETDGNMVKVAKAEVAGELELTAILSSILTHMRQRK